MTTELDIIRRNIKRELPCKLADDEFTRIAKQRALKELEVAQLEADLAKEKKRRQDQIDDLADEVAKMGRELATGEQDRTVPCNDVFMKGVDGTGWVHTIRLDTGDEVERRPATAHETQRYLPGTGDASGGGLLDIAAAAQRKAEGGEASDVPEGGTAEDDRADDESEDKPKAKGKKRS
ncbi:MAG TPA: hypothetical protein VGG74_21150 [Kofleriaceae bacterium]|jgi:hypothetical protein